MSPTDLLREQHNALVDLVPIPPVADELAERFAAAGHRLYLVGGSVRDALLDRGADDLDFTTDARPAAVLATLEGWADAVWDTGIAFGTVGARRHGRTVEITTFRADSYDRVTRNPVVAFGESIEDDLVRRAGAGARWERYRIAARHGIGAADTRIPGAFLADGVTDVDNIMGNNNFGGAFSGAFNTNKASWSEPSYTLGSNYLINDNL
ncbi:MAG: hypothetical protein L0I24_23435, partial [Pseudonocardia sp.]|nr:hypothetical protein [Pseudonocardia sp.]